MAHRLDHARGQLAARRALAGMKRELHPVELGQHVVGQVERPVGEDVALGSPQHAERRQRLVRRGDLLGLAPQPSASSPGTTRTFGVWSQIAR